MRGKLKKGNEDAWGGGWYKYKRSGWAIREL